MTLTPGLLAQRFGYGLPQAPAAPADGVTMLDALGAEDRAAAAFPVAGLAIVAPAMDKAEVLRKPARTDPVVRQQYRDALRDVGAIALQGTRSTVARALSGQDDFRERLVAFWADHFTAVPKGRTDAALPLALVDEAIRPHLTGRFSDMLEAVTLHPAMLVYLDQVLSFGPNSRLGQRRKRGLNENLARELIELHTMGVGSGYTQDDVRQMAELLTGLAVGKDGAARYLKPRAEPGPETVLGVTYEGEDPATVRRALRDLAARPETLAHLARKLAVHFVADDPDPVLVEAVRAALAASDGRLIEGYRALVLHPAAASPVLGKARQPFDFMVAALRALDIGPDAVMNMAEGPFRRLILDPLGKMGQPFRRPPGPDGWPEEAGEWISPQGLAARITWAMEAPGRLAMPLPDPRRMLDRALGDLAGGRLRWAVERAENPREGVGLILAAPEFNRR